MGPRTRKRSLDGRQIENKASDHEKRMGELQGLGEKFEEDKKDWEEKYKEIESDDSMDRSEKLIQLRLLKAEIETVQKEYEVQVAELQEEEIEEYQANIAEMEDLIQELNEQADSLSQLKSKSGVADSQAAADKARDRAKEYEDWAVSKHERRNSVVEEFETQRESVANTNL
ncbi:MAG: hypothetical protein Q4E73_05705 [Lachnospiraceae bacterium]|nr:hypothetical protein [Lachnospiraceae bacterium]